MTLAELKKLIAADLLDAWQERAETSDEKLTKWLEDGIPIDWAEQFAALFKRLPSSKWPKLLHPPKLLHNTPVKARVNPPKMHAQHKLRISEGQAKRDKDFKEKLRKAGPGYTQASIAAAVGMQASLLSMCRSGERAMFLSRAKRIEQLTGWPADKAHWPGGIIEDA